MFKKEQLHFGRFAFLTVLLVAMLAVVGCESESDDIPSGPPETVDYLIHQGWQKLNAGEIDDAITTFNEAANAEADNLEAYLGLGYAYARSNEPVRAQSNFGNVIGLVEVLLTDPENPLDQAVADTLLAEAYAGKTAAYLAAQNYSDAIADAELCVGIWENFAAPVHRWLPGVTLDDVKLMKANAHYGAGEYNLAMLIVDELSNNAFIAGATQINEVNETLTVTLLQDTPVNGIASLEVSNLNLIHPVSVEDASGNLAEITGFDAAGDMIQFRANPMPAQGDLYTVEYYYATDFGEFLIELRAALAGLE